MFVPPPSSIVLILTETAGNGAMLYLVMSIEIALGLICGCLPGIRPLLSRVLPRYFGGGARSNSHGCTYGNTVNNKRNVSSGLGARRAGFRDLKTMEVRTDIELCVQCGQSGVSAAEDIGRLDNPLTRNGSEDKIIP